VILAQLSDPHLRGDGAGEDALRAGVSAVLSMSRLPDALLLSGDVSDAGRPEDYALVAEMLHGLPLPAYVMPGNHDDPEAMHAAFPGPEGERFQYAFDVAGVRVVACDTTIPGAPGGTLDLEWLDAQVRDGAPAIVAMHHPPIEIGMPFLDGIMLGALESEGLAALLSRSPHVLGVITGHTHRAAFGLLGGAPVVSCPGIHLTARLDIGAPGYDVVREPPAFAIHLVHGGTLVSHIQPVVR
jgi:3',5'-cyclic AMP phosphodiesterase CpdA